MWLNQEEVANDYSLELLSVGICELNASDRRNVLFLDSYHESYQYLVLHPNNGAEFMNETFLPSVYPRLSCYFKAQVLQLKSGLSPAAKPRNKDTNVNVLILVRVLLARQRD